MSPSTTDTYDEKLVRAIHASIGLARSLDYAVEEMTLAVAVQDGGTCTCQFSPVECGFGGDLSVVVEMDSGRVKHFVRGQ